MIRLAIFSHDPEDETGFPAILIRIKFTLMQTGIGQGKHARNRK